MSHLVVLCSCRAHQGASQGSAPSGFGPDAGCAPGAVCKCRRQSTSACVGVLQSLATDCSRPDLWRPRTVLYEKTDLALPGSAAIGLHHVSFRRPVLFPTELRAQEDGACKGNKPRPASALRKLDSPRDTDARPWIQQRRKLRSGPLTLLIASVVSLSHDSGALRSIGIVVP